MVDAEAEDVRDGVYCGTLQSLPYPPNMYLLPSAGRVKNYNLKKASSNKADTATLFDHPLHRSLGSARYDDNF